MSKWLKYNLSQEVYNPIGVNTVVSNKNDLLHNLLFETAKRRAVISYVNEDGINPFLEYIDEDTFFSDDDDIIFVNEYMLECDREYAIYYINLNNWKFIEKNNSYDNYYTAPTVICTNRNINKSKTNGPSIIRFEINLGPYWDASFISLSELGATSDSVTTNMIDQYPYNSIIYYDYVNETANIENAVEVSKRKIPFRHISIMDKININYKKYGRRN